MKEFLEAACWTAFARDVMTTSIRVIMAAETYEMSVLSFTWYIAAAQVALFLRSFIHLFASDN